jgi:hypothetical protein
VAGLFGFRRRERAADADGGDPPDTIDLDAGVARADGALEWVGADDEGTLPITPTSPTSPITPTSPTSPTSPITPGEHERSDPARAATEGVWEVIRPAAIVPEHAARRVLVALARRDLSNGGEWQSEPQLWSLFDGPLAPDGSPAPALMGTIHVTYGTPTKYEITLYRVTVTAGGVAAGWTVASLTDEALRFGGLTLAECPRAVVNAPPRPYTY